MEPDFFFYYLFTPVIFGAFSSKGACCSEDVSCGLAEKFSGSGVQAGCSIGLVLERETVSDSSLLAGHGNGLSVEAVLALSWIPLNLQG